MFRGTRNSADFTPVWRQCLMLILVIALCLWARLALPWEPPPGRRVFLLQRQACRR